MEEGVSRDATSSFSADGELILLHAQESQRNFLFFFFSLPFLRVRNYMTNYRNCAVSDWFIDRTVFWAVELSYGIRRSQPWYGNWQLSGLLELFSACISSSMLHLHVCSWI